MHGKITRYTILLVLFWGFYNQSVAQPFTGKGLRLMQVISRISNSYVDSVNISKMEEDAIRSILKKLDPHSVFVKKTDAQRQSDRLNGSYVGIGVYYNFVNDTAAILQPIVGGPAYTAGIQTGDRIVMVDSVSIAGNQTSTSKISKLLRGQEGSKVKLKVHRRGENDLLEMELERGKIKDKSITSAFKLSESIGYLRFNRFAATTFDEINMVLVKFKRQGITDLVIDLRDNGGGYLNSVIKIADNFLDEGKLIVYTEGINKPKRTYFASERGTWEDGRVVVLVNEASASASEILAGAIQDWDRGLIIGRRSYGKGLVQNTFTLHQGDVLRLTIAKYYTPSGRLIQKPYDKGHEAYSKDLIERYNTGELMNKDSVHFPSKDKYFTRNSNRVVYAGGGIMPDIFVPLDTLKYPQYYRDLMQNRKLYPILDEFFLDEHQKIADTYANFSAFKDQYTIPDFLIDKLRLAANKEKDPKPSIAQQNAMVAHIKATFARNIWSSNEYMQTLAPLDVNIQRAVEVLRNPELYTKKLTAAK